MQNLAQNVGDVVPADDGVKGREKHTDCERQRAALGPGPSTHKPNTFHAFPRSHTAHRDGQEHFWSIIPTCFFLLSPKSPLSTEPTTGGAPIATQLLELDWQLLSNKDMDKLRSHKEKASKTLLMSTLGIIFTSPQSPHDPAASLLLVSKQAVLLTGALLDAAALLQCVSAQLAVEVFLPKFSKPDVAAVVVQCPAGEVAIETCPGKRGQRG